MIDRLFRWIGIAAVLAAGAVLYLPVVVVGLFSLNSADKGMVWQGLSSRWYYEAWKDEKILGALWNSCQIAGLALGISIVIGIGGGFVLSRAKGIWLAGLAGIALFPLVTPDLLLGLANALLLKILDVDKGMIPIALAQSVVGSAYVVVVVAIRLRTVDFDAYIRAAQSLGASPLRVFWNHYLPLAREPLMVGGGVVIVFSLQDFIYAFFLGNSGSTTLSVHVYSLVRFGPNGALNVIYLMLFAIAFVGVVLAGRTSSKKGRNSSDYTMV